MGSVQGGPKLWPGLVVPPGAQGDRPRRELWPRGWMLSWWLAPWPSRLGLWWRGQLCLVEASLVEDCIVGPLSLELGVMAPPHG